MDEEFSNSRTTAVEPQSRRAPVVIGLSLVFILMNAFLLYYLLKKESSSPAQKEVVSSFPPQNEYRYWPQQKENFIRAKVAAVGNGSVTIEGTSQEQSLEVALPSDAYYRCGLKYIPDPSGTLIPRSEVRIDSGFITDEWIANLKPDIVRQSWFMNMLISEDIIELTFDPNSVENRVIYAMVIKDECPEEP